ncbi:MAG TPA: polyhydroxyalkanoic acid system family protein [Bryobacteraceae bacterium]|nr:polyhydroxyalkanoic acid system family protein [Bryobacteraceae bacterium]
MRITIAHNKGRERMIQMVDRAFDEVFKGVAQVPVTIANQQKSWQGPLMTFSLIAKMGFINPISGTVAVTDNDVTFDADLGMLAKLIPAEKIQTALQTRLRGLLA